MALNTENITSLQNPKIKEVAALRNRSDLRREKGVFLVEGKRELTRCLEGGWELSSLFYCPSIIDRSAVEALLSAVGTGNVTLFEVNGKVYEKIACRDTTEGIVALVRTGHPRKLEELRLPENPVVVVLESVEKPGNLGAILRTADASGVDAVLVCDPLTDLYNPNLIRASVGALFTQQVVACTSEAAIDWLKRNRISILTAQLQDSVQYYDADMTAATALVFGTESEGLSDRWRVAADRRIRIPMLGISDSLNVSVSAAILCYEALRQRQCKR